MKATIYITGKIGKETTLVDVIRQFKSFEDVTEVEVFIHSEGGNVEDGEAIYNYLVALDKDYPVTTITDKAYSIAAKVFAAGQNRIVEDADKALMIHFAWAKAEGTADKFEAIAEVLREMEDEFATFYSDFLNIDEEAVRSLLDNETFISGTDAVELGFATEVKVVAEAVAEFDINKSKIKTMNKDLKKKSKGQALLEAMAAFVGIDLKTQEVEVKAELTLQDSNGTEIVFPDLDSGDTPKVDDKATIDGANIPDGSYIMPSLEDQTLVFVGGMVSEIIPKEDEEEETEAKEEKTETGAKEDTEVKAEEIKEVSVWSVEVANTSFEIGEVVNYEFDGETYPVSAGEFQLNDGKRIVTDASGVIVKIKEVEEVETTTATEASFEDLLEKVTEKIKAEVNAELLLKEKEITALKAKIGSKEFKSEKKEVPETGKEKGTRASRILRAANL